MPGNWGYLGEDTKNYLTNNFPASSTILDIGCGHGFYKKLLGDYFTGRFDAVEIWQPYIDEYNLIELYDNLYNVNILDFDFEYYDIIIMGDILEHLSKDDSIKLINKLKDKCKELIVVVPYYLPQDECFGNKYEIHLQPDLDDACMAEQYPCLELIKLGDRELKVRIDVGDQVYYYCAFKKKNNNISTKIPISSDMKVVVTTLSLGRNYTKDYTLRMVEDILKLSDIDFYITTDCKDIIESVYPNNPRIHINEFNRDDYKVRLPIGPLKGASDFNFNLRYLCFEPVKDLDNTIVIFTDCDNSFDWYDKNEVFDHINEIYNNQGFDFLAPRTDYFWKIFRNDYKSQDKMEHGMLWHKVHNYDLDLNNQDLDESSVPAEYLLIFINNNGKLAKFYDKWKWYHDYLANKEWTHGTWAEGFEIGASAFTAGFKAYDISWHHPIWGKMFEANGYKTGKRGGVVHATEASQIPEPVLEINPINVKKHRLQFNFEYPHNDWAVLHVFKAYYDFFVESNPEIECTYKNSSASFNGNSSGPNSAQIMVIRNLDTGKYIIISYWDNPIELTWNGNGWDHENCIDIIATSGAMPNMNFIKFSYISYLKIFETLSLGAKEISQKTKNELSFRGFLYGDRLALSETGKIDITNKKLHPDDVYFNNLTDNKICLSLNGAAEICNRDMEILSARSVLFRPKLNVKFHNDLIADYHYVSFETNSDPNIQADIILEKFNQIKDNDEFLSAIANNGYKWYQQNATIDSNVNIIKDIFEKKDLLNKILL
jgi:hypothetical protein